MPKFATVRLTREIDELVSEVIRLAALVESYRRVQRVIDQELQAALDTEPDVAVSVDQDDLAAEAAVAVRDPSIELADLRRDYQQLLHPDVLPSGLTQSAGELSARLNDAVRRKDLDELGDILQELKAVLPTDESAESLATRMFVLRDEVRLLTGIVDSTSDSTTGQIIDLLGDNPSDEEVRATIRSIIDGL